MMNAENTAAVIDLLASMAADCAGVSVGTIRKQCPDQIRSPTIASILWPPPVFPMCVATDWESGPHRKVPFGSTADSRRRHRGEFQHAGRGEPGFGRAFSFYPTSRASIEQPHRLGVAVLLTRR